MQFFPFCYIKQTTNNYQATNKQLSSKQKNKQVKNRVESRTKKRKQKPTSAPHNTQTYPNYPYSVLM